MARREYRRCHFLLRRRVSLCVRRWTPGSSPWDRDLRRAHDAVDEFAAPGRVRRLAPHRARTVDALGRAYDVLAAARVEAEPHAVLVPVVVAALLQHVVGPEVDDLAELADRHHALVALHLVHGRDAVVADLEPGDVETCVPYHPWDDGVVDGDLAADVGFECRPKSSHHSLRLLHGDFGPGVGVAVAYTSLVESRPSSPSDSRDLLDKVNQARLLVVLDGDALVGQADGVEVVDELIANPRFRSEALVLHRVRPDRSAHRFLDHKDLQHHTAARLVGFALLAGRVHGEKRVVRMDSRHESSRRVVAAAEVAGSAVATASTYAVVTPGSVRDVRAVVSTALFSRRLPRAR